MSRGERILELLPAILAAREPGRLIGAVVRALAVPLDEADATLMAIRRAHRLTEAETVPDLVRLAALVDLPTGLFADLTGEGPLPRPERLERLRTRIRRLAALHLRGLASPPAILDTAAALLDAVPVPDAAGRICRPVDGGGRVTRMQLRLADDPQRGDASVILDETPARERRAAPAPFRPGEGWEAQAGAAEARGVRLVMTGAGERSVMPVVVCPATGEGLVFDGILADGETLVFDEDGRARLDGRAVDDRVIRFRAALTDGPVPDAGVSDERTASAGLTGYRPAAAPLVLPAGASRWEVQVAVGVANAARADFAVLDQPDDPVGLWDEADCDAAVYDTPPSLQAGMRWLERMPCAFKLTLPRARPQDPAQAPARQAEPPPPARIPDFAAEAETGAGTAEPGAEAAAEAVAPSAEATPADAPTAARSEDAHPPQLYADRVAPFLTRFRAAGIQAFVATAPEAWVLDETRLEPLDATEGPGAAWATATLNRLGENPLVHLDP